MNNESVKEELETQRTNLLILNKRITLLLESINKMVLTKDPSDYKEEAIERCNNLAKDELLSGGKAKLTAIAIHKAVYKNAVHNFEESLKSEKKALESLMPGAKPVEPSKTVAESGLRLVANQ